jgi:hypothetical protein
MLWFTLDFFPPVCYSLRAILTAMGKQLRKPALVELHSFRALDLLVCVLVSARPFLNIICLQKNSAESARQVRSSIIFSLPSYKLHTGIAFGQSWNGSSGRFGL